MRILTAALVLGSVLGLPAAKAEPKFIFQKNSGLPVTVFNLTFRVGSADDTKGREGLSEFTANLMREGGVRAWHKMPARTRAEIEDFLFPYAADIGVSTAKEQISFQVVSSAADARAVFEVLAQMILAPAFETTELERIREVTLDALKNRFPREDQEELGKAALDQRIYGASHPYAHVTTGTVKGVQAATADDVKSFYQTYFTQKRLTVGVAGMVSTSLEQEIRSVFSELPEGTTGQTQIPEPPEPHELRLLLVKGPFDAVGAHLGQSVPFNRSDKDFAKMYLAALAFGKHRSFVGRLMKVVREERGLNYGTYAYVEDFPQGGQRMIEPTQSARTRQAFTVWARPSTLENGCFLLRQVHREVRELATRGLSEEEFNLAQSHLIGNAPLLAIGLERRLGYAIDSEFYGLKHDYLEWLQSQAKKATQPKVNALLKKYIHPDQLEIVVVTPDPDRFKTLIQGPRCDITYAPGIKKPPEVLKEDAVISTYSLGLKPENISVVDSEDLFDHKP